MSATTYTFTPENSYILNRLGANNGIAELDSSGKVPASQLPSYVDDVVEVPTYDDFPITGESGKIYVDLSTNKTYRWGGSSYVEISESLALGETESTAYRGDRGKEAYDHATLKGRGFSSGFYKVATNTEGHVTNVVPVAKSDIVNLGIPGDDFVGATTEATGVHGYVPAPAVEDRNKFLSGNGTWKEAPGAKLIEVVLTPVSNESGAYTGTTRDFRITAGMKCIMLELGNPAAFKSNITVTAGAGIVTLTCASVEGESSATASFLKTAEDPTAITTSEFDYLENAKVDKAPTAVEGHFVSFNTVGNLIDSGYSANNVLIVPSDVTEGKVPRTNSSGEIVWTDLESVTVENNLTSTSTTNALSAAQGKALNDTKAPIADPNFTGSISLGRKANTTVGGGSVAEGANVTASGSYSHSEGAGTAAVGIYSHAEGAGTTAVGSASHAEGAGTRASGTNSHSEGGGTTANGDNSHVEGSGTVASGSNSHAEGNNTTANGNLSHAEGNGNTTATKTIDNQTYTGTGAHGEASHAEGANTWAIGRDAHAEGGGTTASGDNSHAEGEGTIASGYISHAEGSGAQASGDFSHAEGGSTIASGAYSHVEGSWTIAAGRVSHVGGEYNIEDSYANWPEWTAGTSYEVGDKVKVTTGSGSSQTIQGYICKTANSDSTFKDWNWKNQYKKMNYAEIIGNGTYDTRSNARALDWDGNEHLAGDLYVHCNADSTGGNKVATTTELANKLDKPSNVPAGKFLQTDSNGNAVWGDSGSSEPHNYALDGTDLTTVFADADALFAAYSTEDYSKIHVGDYWPVTLNGDYWDYGNFTCPSGVTYYSDNVLTAEVGVTAQSYDAECVADAQLPYGLKPYCTIKISNVSYYVDRTECLDHRVRTLSNAIVNFVVGGINQYWRYGDSGSDNFHNGRPHLLMEARDGIPHTLKMRKQNEAWEGVHVDVFTGDGTTSEFSIDGTVGTIGYVWVAGTRKAYDTDYTFGRNKITFKSGKIPASGAKVEVEWMDAKAPWTGSALYKTFNDPDHGILNLIKAADLKLYNHMYKGPNAKGMRYYAETRNKTNQQGGAWEDRGVLFLPMEDEIWGRPIYSATGLNPSTQMQQWPIYGNGGRRQYAKCAGNDASRYYVWCASSASVTYFAYVGGSGFPYGSSAYNVLVAAPCFLLS